MIGIIGAIVGDLIGQSYEFHSTKDYNFKLLTDTSHVTDDSTCTIAVADWLLHTNRTHDELIDKFKYWCNKYNYGFAPRFKNWVNSDNREPYNSFGNGSAMRVSPVAWVANSLEECIQLAKISAEVTHNHPEGIKGAITIAVAIYLNRQGKTKDEIINYILNETDYKLQSYDELHRTHKFNCICQCSVPACLTCWYESNSYEDCIRKAVSLGGDADTEACIAGSICNANTETSIDDSFAKQLCLDGYIPNEFIDIINEFHEKYEMQIMKDINIFIKESNNPIQEKYPNVLTLGDGEYKGILWGHCFLYENNKYWSEMGWKNCFPSYCKMVIENGKTTPHQIDEYQRKDLKKLFE